MINAAKLAELRVQMCGDCWHRADNHDLQNGHCLDPHCTCPRSRSASCAQLAKKAGLSRQAVSRLERRGDQVRGSNPEYATVVALARALGVEPSDLMLYERPGNPLGN